MNAHLTEGEKYIFSLIQDEKLLHSLTSIRDAMVEIWPPNLRVIRDYTDHGEKHCGRVAQYASDILRCGSTTKLTEHEAYVLLAAIYLHDLGMQCDLRSHPDIKAYAELKGAHFAEEYPQTPDLSVSQQKDIRKNHHILSAAWIDYAFFQNKTSLAPAARSIDELLVVDVMDVCMHHSTLPIAGCPQSFKYDPSQRKQLVAALLRFADELDIAATRVDKNVEAVKNYFLSPANAVYWWLHRKTNIKFLSKNEIFISLILHPKDFSSFGALLQQSTINEFITKNQPSLNILNKHGFPIVISTDSKVLAEDHSEELPQLIRDFLSGLEKPPQPVVSLVDEIRLWLRALRFEIEQLPGNSSDRKNTFLASIHEGPIDHTILVECVEGEIDVDDVARVGNLVPALAPRAWIICEQRVNQSARKSASATVQVFTLQEFLREKIWQSYFNWLVTSVESRSIEKRYLDLDCHKELVDGSTTKVSGSLLTPYVDRWLLETGKVHISLLGEFGSGKTWFCRHYAYHRFAEYLKDPIHQRLPLLITLRTFAKAMTAKQLVNEALLEQYRLPFVGGAYEVFRELNRRGKILLILDGFDEMARQVNYQTIVDNFWELATLVDNNSKVILTSRTEYFRLAKEPEKIFGGMEYGRRTVALKPPRFEVLHISPLDKDRICRIISAQLEETTQSPVDVANRILSQPNLAEMATKPVLIELLVAALSEVSPSKLEDITQVYLHATNSLLLRNIATERTFTRTSDKLYFLCELAWEMISASTMQIHYSAIPQRIRSYFGNKIKGDRELDEWDNDLRSQTLLHRNAAGYYEFAHKSLAEFFVALKFAVELGCGIERVSRAYVEQHHRQAALLLEPKLPSVLALTFGSIPLADDRYEPIRRFLLGFIDKSSFQRLWDVINEARGLGFQDIKYVCGNAVTLLTLAGDSFANRNLSKCALNNAHFPNDLSGIDLSGAALSNVQLFGRNLRGANLSGVTADAGSMVGADLRGAAGLEDSLMSYVSMTARTQGIHTFPDEERLLLDFIRSAKPEDRVAGIFGPESNGKSALLLSVARHAGNHFWFDGSGTTDADSQTHAPDFYRGVATFIAVAGSPTLQQYLEDNDYAPEKLEDDQFRGTLVEFTVTCLSIIEGIVFVDNYDFLKDIFFLSEIAEVFGRSGSKSKFVFASNHRNPEKFHLLGTRVIKLLPRRSVGMGLFGRL